MSTEYNSYVPELIEATEKGATGGLRAISIAIVSQAKALAPVASVNGGLLRNSIMHKEAGGRTSGHEGGPKLSETPTKGEMIVGSAVEYAIYQEYGTRKMAAQPFLRPAVDIFANGAKGKQAMKDAIYNSVQEKLKRES